MTAVAEMQKKPRQIVIEWIEHILDRKKWTGTDLARKSGLAPSTILRLMNDPDHPFVPSLKTLQKVAEGSGYPIPRQVMAVLGANRMQDEEAVEDTPRPKVHRPASVELRHVSSLPAALQAAANSKREAYVQAPPQLEGDETAFAFHMPDDTFDPWVKSGSLVYATKRRDPVKGDTVMITGKDGKTRVRSLMGMDEGGLSLSRSLPVKEDEKMAFDDISDIALVCMFVKAI